ncbi:ABC transporter permease [Chitinophaga ginsengisegetis]|uniref:ABC transporter permease n=1 Tax=Chitinophaga ginsengisegetis TaxID=393003 RepID=UPI000DBA653C|nr:ABC transporter permease [Chitinophaga ginsengisegetis]MDR6569927.1 putative permease [Chitinophaga ginsengisegetis]MDR6649660.1 putative permease [Chitinophaga ginsengisegetis]MDR6656137.1 putative permease [Chitinophaga ginsengisegetis]
MINSYFILSFRTLWRKKSFSLLNIVGLAVGIGASLLIFLVIRNEMSYDTYQSKRDRIFRVVTTFTSRSTGEKWRHSMVPAPLASAMRRDFPTLQKVAVAEHIGGAQVYVPGENGGEEKKFKESGGLFFVEPAIFDIFDFSWLYGSAAELKEPNTVALTQSMAEAYFGNYKNAIGKIIQLWSYRVPLRVTGVFKDLPYNTDLPVRMAASHATWLRIDDHERQTREDWRSLSGGTQCFALTSPEDDIGRLQAQLPAFVKNNYREDADQTTGFNSLTFQPLKEMHLDKRFATVKDDSLSVTELWALAIIGVFLLMVACINFINLATAQSVNRAKEIGIRKVLGSNRRQLLKQFLGETALITASAIILGSIMAWLAIPYLSNLVGKTLELNPLRYPSILLFLILSGVIVTFLAGFYPAIVLSGFNPVAAIKSRINIRPASGISLRRALVVFQFVVAQLLVIGTLVVVKQMKFFREEPMGFEKEAVVLLDLPSDSTLKLKYSHLKSRLLQLPGVEAGSLCSIEPASHFGRFTDFYYNNEANRQPYSVKRINADTGYFNTFRLGLVAGRYPFSDDSTREVLVNETVVRKLGLRSAEDIIGKTVAVDNGSRKFPVAGVLRDFNNNSLRDEISPSVISSDNDDYGTLALRLNPEKVPATLKQIEQIFTAVYPTYIYDCTFFDDQIGNFYRAEAITAALFKVFAFLAIFISCLGLYGLVSFMVVQKTKEVGIRKVLGASVQSILYLFSREFTTLIGIAFLVAAPVGYYFMKKWLLGFHYHAEIGWGIFVLAIVLSILIAWIAVGYKAIRAALANPVKSLRAE